MNVYPVYKSSPWLFSRYSDDTGGKITTVRTQYMPYWKDLISQIPFQDWIFNQGTNKYTIVFTRSYILYPVFQVYDETGKMGKDTETKAINLN